MVDLAGVLMSILVVVGLAVLALLLISIMTLVGLAVLAATIAYKRTPSMK
ncbi:hypothetical protein [Acrocarpospora catenulata]|nr:hypothetical protein [Acrocarpospora catenulata]